MSILMKVKISIKFMETLLQKRMKIRRSTTQTLRVYYSLSNHIFHYDLLNSKRSPYVVFNDDDVEE